jgi:hypothetical protein
VSQIYSKAISFLIDNYDTANTKQKIYPPHTASAGDIGSLASSGGDATVTDTATPAVASTKVPKKTTPSNSSLSSVATAEAKAGAAALLSLLQMALPTLDFKSGRQV